METLMANSYSRLLLLTHPGVLMMKTMARFQLGKRVTNNLLLPSIWMSLMGRDERSKLFLKRLCPMKGS